jgi:hypothetical protein
MMKTARPEKNKEDEDEDTSPDSVYPNPPCCCGKESPIECGVYCKKHTTREWCEPVCERNPSMPCIQFKRKKRAKEKAEEKLISDRVARETRDAGEMSPASLRRFNEMYRDVDRFDENWTSSLVLPWFDALPARRWDRIDMTPRWESTVSLPPVPRMEYGNPFIGLDTSSSRLSEYLG